MVPDCNDLHCFRALVAWTLGTLPGPSTIKWRSYAVACNAVAAVMVLQLCLTFGLSARAAWTASILSALGFGALYTLHDAYTSDPLMYALGPLMTNELLRGRRFVAAAIGTIGVFAKEFAAASGVQNLDLRTASITDVTPEWGTFDYIVAHGVFSWVPRDVAEKVLQICAEQLTENGLAYVSFKRPNSRDDVS